MNHPPFPYRIFPLGDGALTIDYGNRIDEAINAEVIHQFNNFSTHPFPGMTEAVPAYSSLTVYYDAMLLRKLIPAGSTVFDWVKKQAEAILSLPTARHDETTRLIKIPVCYEKELAPDLAALAAANNITTAEVVSIHTSVSYRVFMMGFLPGFAYMGGLDSRIAMPRKPQPKNIAAGSVGIAGRQTGIYPLASPGGWQIIGRTPLTLFDAKKEESTLLQTGDTILFYSISRHEFENY